MEVWGGLEVRQALMKNTRSMVSAEGCEGPCKMFEMEQLDRERN